MSLIHTAHFVYWKLTAIVLSLKEGTALVGGATLHFMSEAFVPAISYRAHAAV